MIKFALPFFINIVLLLPCPAGAQTKHYPLESADGLRLQQVSAQPAVLHGKKGLRLTISEEMRRRIATLEKMSPEEREKSLTADERARLQTGLPFLMDQLAEVADLSFSSGVIEVELAGAPEPGAGEGARGFVGIVFRKQGDSSYDTFYLRPTNGRADDQERRNHTAQYMSYPNWPWPRLRKESPGKYESYVDVVPGEWTKIRIEVRGERARLFVHGNPQPTLVVNDVKSGAAAKGSVALWLGPETVAHFRNLTVTVFDKD
jgi:hypothetical protein